MAAQYDMFQITITGTNQSETFVNAFYYRLMDIPSEGHLSGLVNEFNNAIVETTADYSPAWVTFDLISAKNLWTGDELIAIPPTRTGSRSGGGQGLPSFIAAHCKLIRSNNRVRHGHKYLTGLLEEDMLGQVWTEGTRAWLSTIASTYAQDLHPGLADLYKPVIIGRVLAPKKNGPGNAYRLPESAAEMGDNWAYITGAAFSPDVTTMRSRKAGHGI